MARVERQSWLPRIARHAALHVHHAAVLAIFAVLARYGIDRGHVFVGLISAMVGAGTLFIVVTLLRTSARAGMSRRSWTWADRASAALSVVVVACLLTLSGVGLASARLAWDEPAPAWLLTTAGAAIAGLVLCGLAFARLSHHVPRPVSEETSSRRAGS
jgi:hypothetical protein